MRSRLRRIAVSSLLLAGCTRDPDILNPTFSDELVDADARKVDISAVEGGDCEKALSRPHSSPGSGEKVAGHESIAYPVDPTSDPLSSFPRGTPLALDVAALDETGRQIARGCIAVSLDEDTGKTIDIPLHALPVCQTAPSRLDIEIVLDVSQKMETDADPEGVHLDLLRDTLLTDSAFIAGTHMGLLLYGPENKVSERVPSTTDREALRIALQELYSGAHRGSPVLFDAVTEASKILRARAVCGTKPALLIVAGTGNLGGTANYQDAQMALYGAQGDTTDDLFAVGIGLTQNGFDHLSGLVPEAQGSVTGAGTRATQERAMIDARETLNALLVGQD